MNQGSNFLGSSFSNVDRYKSSIFTSIAPELLDWSNEISFSRIEINKLLPAPAYNVSWARVKFRN